MDGEIVGRAEVWVLGVMQRIVPGEADYRAIWEGSFMPRHEEIRAIASEPGYYGAYFPTGEEGKVDFLAGMPVKAGTRPPAGLILREAPAGRYAAFDCRMSEIAATWRSIYGEWLPRSAYGEDPARPCLEEYPPDATGPEATIRIYVPVIER